jgi:hypothetical protein
VRHQTHARRIQINGAFELARQANGMRVLRGEAIHDDGSGTKLGLEAKGESHYFPPALSMESGNYLLL